MSKIVYIASLSHSGSTLFDLLLGSNSRIISMGEIHSAIKRFDEPQRICTCGKEIEECIIWGGLRKILRKKARYNYAYAYCKLLKIVDEVYGKDKFIVDSSKNLSTLKYLIRNNIKDMHILFLIKDIRSYVLSQSRRKYYKKLMDKEGWRRIYRTSLVYNILNWYKNNKKIKYFLEENRLKYFQLGYEELCFKPEVILRQVSDFIDIKFEERMLKPKNSESHIIRGNELRYNNEKLEGIYYDNRWFYDKKYFFLSPFFLPFIDWNNNNVYSNIKLKTEL